MFRLHNHHQGDQCELPDDGCTGCPTCYRTRRFFNNSNTNEDIATKFEQEYVRCVRNEEECVCSVCLYCVSVVRVCSVCLQCVSVVCVCSVCLQCVFVVRVFSVCLQRVCSVCLQCVSSACLQCVSVVMYITISLWIINLQTPCVLDIRTGVSLLSRERFLYI